MSDTLAGKTVLVTGATGFIGRHLVNALRARNAEIRVLARNAAKIALLSSDDRVVGIARDLSQPGNLIDVCRDVDTIFHLASEGEAKNAAGPSAGEWQQGATVGGTRMLLEAALQAGYPEPP